MPERTATWNSARGVWERAESNILCGHSALWSETFPTSGMWDGTGLYPLRLSAPRTGGNGFSSPPGLLPTPRANERQQYNSRDSYVALSLLFNEGHLLATPRASDGGKQGEGARGSSSGFGLRNQSREIAVLPTPTAEDSKASGGAASRADRQEMLHTLVRREWAGETDPPLLPTFRPQAGGGGGGYPDPPGRVRSPENPGGFSPNLMTVVSELLPTPDSGVTPNGHGRRGGKPGNGHQSGETLETIAGAMLPTPNSRDWKGSPSAAWDGQASLPRAVERDMLPTPQSRDWKGSAQRSGRIKATTGKLYWDGEDDLPTAVEKLESSSTQPSMPTSRQIPGQMTMEEAL